MKSVVIRQAKGRVEIEERERGHISGRTVVVMS